VIVRTTLGAGLWTSARDTPSLPLECSVVPQSRPPFLAGRTRHRAKHRRNRRCPSTGVTGENSPLYTNQPAKMKTDRVLVKYFFAGTWLRHKCQQPVDSSLRSVEVGAFCLERANSSQDLEFIRRQIEGLPLPQFMKVFFVDCGERLAHDGVKRPESWTWGYNTAPCHLVSANSASRGNPQTSARHRLV
jgi:hypothetical protein